MNSLYQQLNFKVRDVVSENEQLKAELAEVKYRLEAKEKNELKLDNKIKALERVINSVRTPSARLPTISDNEVFFLI